jgi:peptidoglycan-associated lipoprotein
MKLAKLLNLTLAAALLASAGAGCRKNPNTPMTNLPNYSGRVKPPTSDFSSGPIVPINPGPTTTENTLPTPTGIPLGTKDFSNYQVDPTEPLKSQTIHFDFDRSTIKSGDESKLDEVANYMKSHADVALRVEGNCDERGTEEYNRSLGERRALAAREYLAHAGIDATRVVTVTYGEDKPVNPGHNEAAWAENRRDDFSVLLPPK